MTPFHLAFPVDDLAQADKFYCQVLGCQRGRASGTWIDFSMFGHQISAHLKPGAAGNGVKNDVEGVGVPIPHFGVILDMDDWKTLAERLESHDDIDWIERPFVRFIGKPAEQATMFIRDPSGNALEFKGFASMEAIFTSND